VKTIIGVASNDLSSDITAAEAAIGKQFGGYRQNSAMSAVVPNGTDIGFNNQGLWDYRNSNNETPSPASPLFGGWAGVVAGNADSYLASCASAIAANYTPSFPILWSPHHEQNVANAQQCGITCNGSAADYVAFFRYIVTYMRTAGVADRIKFCCVPNIKQYRINDTTDGIQVVDPGASYVDIYGCDIYTMDVDNATVAGLNLVGQYALDRGKPAIIGEFGIHVNSSLGATNLQSALDLFVSQGNWFAVMTDTATMGSLLIPVWQGAVADPAHFAFKGEVTSFPGTASSSTEVFLFDDEFA
jgi:hypothetical protein